MGNPTDRNLTDQAQERSAQALDRLQEQAAHAGRSGLSRRSFLATSALGALGMASAGLLASCSGPKAATEKAAASGSASAESSWKQPPAEVAASGITEQVDCDVVVVGSGFAGVTAFCELCEEGYKAVLVEKQPEATYAAVGNEFAALNAKVLQDRGVEHIDPVEFYQNFVKIAGNAVNPDLVMKFAQNSEANSNWYLDQLTDEDIAAMTTSFFPKTEHQMSELSGIKFWGSVCSFYSETCNQTKIQKTNRDVAAKKGGTVKWGYEGYYVKMADGKVAGLIAKTPEGGYAQFSCKAVVLATGGFGGNPDMMRDLMPDAYANLVGEEHLQSMSTNDGAGVRMAYWAGAHLESTPVPGMNFRGLSVPGKMNCLPQAVWLNEKGRRFCNEYYPTSEQRGLQTVFSSRQAKCAVVDANFPQYRQYTIPQHAGFTASEANIASLQASLDKAYAKFKGTYQESGEEKKEQMGPVMEIEYVADDTLEGLAKQLGYEGDALKAFLAQIEEYNAYCKAGADQQYGRDAKVLFPVDTPPFYGCTFKPEFGETMVTCGGIVTDGEQNALDQDFEPIPGLYVSGNDCGRRFGTEYITPIPGCSLGFALTLGRECGKSVGAFLKASK